MALFAIGCLPFIIEYTLSLYDRKSLSVLMAFLEQLNHFFAAAAAIVAIIVVSLFIGRKPKGIISKLLHCHTYICSHNQIASQ